MIENLNGFPQIGSVDPTGPGLIRYWGSTQLNQLHSPPSPICLKITTITFRMLQDNLNVLSP